MVKVGAADQGYFEPDKQRVKYIATQAPLNNTLDTFWQMVWKLNIRDVYCLTKAQENGKEMAFTYWKNSDESLNEEYRIIVKSKSEEAISIKRDIELTNTLSKESRKLIHFHIEAWDDDKVPTEKEDIDALLGVAEQCSQELKSNKDAKVLVHCSAGIGRTGVFICLVEIYTFLSALAAKSKGQTIQEVCTEDPQAAISIFDIVRSLREQRWGSVKSFVRLGDPGPIQIPL
jgi:protein tyrosine phosphatase